MSRRALIVAHRWHDSAPAAGRAVHQVLTECGWSGVDAADDDGGAFDLAIVLGGDGTFLRAAETVRGRGIPLLAFNLGHLGFLAQADHSDLDRVLRAALAGDFTLEDRATLSARAYGPSGEELHRDWALNEANVERAASRGMLEVGVEVDGKPISVFGCDGVVVATPTGSTAHAFSGGGPVIWPDVDALLFVPLVAHALFARPLVVSPASVLTVEVLRRSRSGAAVTFDGRRVFPLTAGARIDVRRSSEPVRLVRLDGEKFGERLVSKFHLPVAGWRGEKEQA